MQYDSNHGLFWNGRDLRQLNSMMKEGHDITDVAMHLGRSPMACIRVYREIRRMELMRRGSDEDTLHSWKKRVEESEPPDA